MLCLATLRARGIYQVRCTGGALGTVQFLF
jgi:hypothetical protein